MEKNNNDEIVVSVVYLVYLNANNFPSSNNKKDSCKLPWLNTSESSKKTSADQESDDFPNFIANRHKKAEVVNIEENENENKITDATKGNISLYMLI